ncbi:MAG: ABC transporter permease [Planctomycetaceae bacterium]|nr:ABC transporter permease [Planctomycetaceae bacterium]
MIGRQRSTIGDSRWLEKLAMILAPGIVLVLVLLTWQWLVWAREIPKFILPSPRDIALATWSDGARLWAATLRTGSAAIAGLGISVGAGFLLASVLGQARWIRNSFMPYVLVFQTIPIIGVAPLLITWFGNTFSTVMLIAAFISIFPIISNTTTGMVAVDSSHLDLFHLNRASRWQIYRYLQVPTALPYFSAGIRIAAAACVLGACVGDYFVGTAQQEGLGFLVFQAKDRNAGLMFATLFVLTLMGFLFYLTANLVCRLVLLRWEDHRLG